MAEYTMLLKDVVENIFNPSIYKYDFDQSYAAVTYNGITYGKLPTVPDWKLLGMGYYPIFDEAYRPVLNGKILDEFYMREIGVETIDMWLLVMRRKLNNIMPFYNKLYESEKIPYNALDTMNIVSHRTNNVNESQTGTSHNTATSENDSLARAVSSTTPQTMLSGDEDYATGATDSNSQTTNTSTGDANTSATNETDEIGDSTVTGYQAAASDLITKFRGTLLNIDMMIMSDLQECFMGILNTSDDYYQNGCITW